MYYNNCTTHAFLLISHFMFLLHFNNFDRPCVILYHMSNYSASVSLFLLKNILYGNIYIKVVVGCNCLGHEKPTRYDMAVSSLC